MASHLLIAIVASLVAVLVAAGLTPAVRTIALALGAVDAPGERRVHTRIIPRLGGVAIGVAFAVALFVVARTGILKIPSLTMPGLIGFAAGGVLIFFAGIYDDLKSLGAKRKLLAQLGAATLAWFGGARIYEVVNLPFLGSTDIGPVAAYLATVIWILAFTNAINLIDGLDGLAGGVVFFAALTNIVVALITGNDVAIGLNAALAGAVLGFLFYNFNPAKIFMGDTGSLLLGYALSAGALLSSRQKESTLASLLVPIIALGVPLTDTILAMLRRVFERRSIFAADRQHLHHKLLELGLTHRRAVLVLYGCSVALSAIAIAAAFGQDWQVGAAILAAVMVLFGIIRFARYFEGVIQGQDGRHEFSPAAASLRRALPSFVLEVNQASSRDALFAALESALDPGWFPQATIVLEETEEPVWSRLGTQGLRREGIVVEHRVPLELAPGSSAQLRLACEVPGPHVPLDVQILATLVADLLAGHLKRLRGQTPGTLVRLVRESS